MPGALDIRVERHVRNDLTPLFDFLSDLGNHWELADPFIEVLELDGTGPGGKPRGGRVRMRGPFGLRRTAVTRVLEVDPGSRIAGTAQVGARTLARVTWLLAPADGGTCVALTASVERASRLDRALLAAGGARWMRRRLEKILARLDGAVPAGARAPALD